MIGFLILIAFPVFANACSSTCLEGLTRGPMPQAPTVDSYITDPSDLNCDFESDCCWLDDTSDQLDYERVSGADSNRFATCAPGIPIPPLPSGQFAAVIDSDPTNVLKPRDASHQAILQSCPIDCTEAGTPTDVTVTAWRSANARLQLCTRRQAEQPSNCVPIDAPSGTPKTYRLDNIGGTVQLVIVGSGFSAPTEYVGLDDIKVDFTPCPVTTTTPETTTESTTTIPTTPETTTEAGGSNLCEKVVCPFTDASTCEWVSDPSKTSAFKAYEPKTVAGNSDTGVNALQYIGYTSEPQVADSPFAGAAMGRQESASMTATGLDVREDTRMSLRTYDACDEMAIEVCYLVDGVEDCQAITNKGVVLEDRKWREKEITVPKGTTEMTFKADNGNYICAAGITDLTLIDPVTGAKTAC